MAIIGKTPGGGKRKKSTDASKKLNKIKKDNRIIKPSKDKPIKKAPKRPPRKIKISLGQKGTKRDKTVHPNILIRWSMLPMSD